MRRITTSALAALALAAATSGALAQGLPYNRAIDASSLRYEPSSDGAGFQISGEFFLDSDLAEERDLSCIIRVEVNGAVVGPEAVAHVIAGGAGARPNCPDYCSTRCPQPSICFGYRDWFCICISLGSSDSNNGQARFAIPVPPLNPGDVVTVSIIPDAAGLPEIDPIDDTGVLAIPGGAGPAYDRSLLATDIVVEPSPSGHGRRVSGELHLDADGSMGGDLSCTITPLVNGAVAGDPFPMSLRLAGGGGVNCNQFCSSCWANGGICLNFNYFCICFGRRDDGAPPSARFAFDLPDVVPGDVVAFRVDPAPDSLQEIDPTNDAVSVVIPQPRYNRALDASSLTYAPSSDGSGFQIEGDLLFDSDLMEERDLSCLVRIEVNGEVVGPEAPVAVLAGVAGRPGCPSNFCETRCPAPSVCFQYGQYFCFCIRWGGGNGNNGTARFAIPVPQLKPGAVVTVGVVPNAVGLPELDPIDDTGVFVIPGGPGPAYDRGLVASDITIEPSPSGAGSRISGELHLNSDGSLSGDLGCSVTALINGAVAGAPDVFSIRLSGGGVNCGQFCDICNGNGGWCWNFVWFCMCMGRNGSEQPPVARFAIDVPDLAPGDLVSLHIDAAPEALPEIDLTNDQVSFVIGPPPCPGDFNSDGFLNSQDFFDFITAFFAALPSADFNADGLINSQDFFDFLVQFFAGC